ATAALAAYLDAVAAAINRRAIAVAGVQTSTEGQISGRIQLVRQRTRRPRAAVELRWSESTGWEAALRPIRGQPATPWRFLHADLTPQPDCVASFADGLLRGEDLGMLYPARFHAAGTDLTDLTARLTRAAAEGEPRGR
ncbi:MAG: DUF6292 family protein, partial [Actinomycetota bacterium]|nr:DUF6292 family protein [Actinomycetota bacterium]